jgi:hypothetical protein
MIGVEQQTFHCNIWSGQFTSEYVTEGKMPVTLLQACAHNSETPASGHVTKYRFINLEKMALML